MYVCVYVSSYLHTHIADGRHVCNYVCLHTHKYTHTHTHTHTGTQPVQCWKMSTNATLSWTVVYSWCVSSILFWGGSLVKPVRPTACHNVYKTVKIEETFEGPHEAPPFRLY